MHPRRGMSAAGIDAALAEVLLIRLISRQTIKPISSLFPASSVGYVWFSVASACGPSRKLQAAGRATKRPILPEPFSRDP